MTKAYIKFTGTIIINVEKDEEISDVFAEVEMNHPDNTRVVDYSIDNFEITDVK
jgi:hypothetical protein